MTNEALIKKFLEFCKANAMSKLRILKYDYTLRNLSKWLNKDFNKANKDDMIKLMGKIEEMDYKDWTKHDYKVILKRFYKYLNDDKDFPDTVKWIKPTIKKNNQKLPEELLTVEDIDAIVNSAINIRDKAFVRCLYESGCRISEFLGLQIKHIQYDEYSPVITVNGKTGSRRIRLIDKDGLLKAWLNSHPLKDNPDAYVWISRSYETQYTSKGKKTEFIKKRLINQPLDGHSITEMLRLLATKSNVKKKVNPHNFRHSRATHLAVKLTEAQMKQMFGWTQNSGMASIYVHLSGRDLDEPLLKMSGLLDTEIKEEQSFFNNLDKKLVNDSEFRSKFIKFMHDSGVKVK